MTHTEKTINYFSQKLHCSQSVLASFAEECGITEEQSIKLGSCFGTGNWGWKEFLERIPQKVQLLF